MISIENDRVHNVVEGKNIKIQRTRGSMRTIYQSILNTEIIAAATTYSHGNSTGGWNTIMYT